MPKINQGNLNQALQEIRNFIQFLHDNLNAESEDIEALEEPTLILMRRDEGSLRLTGDEARSYEESLNKVHRLIVGKSEEFISKRAIRKLYENAIFKALDIHEQSKQTFDKRLENALKELRDNLQSDL